jgi:hypothetical protein
MRAASAAFAAKAAGAVAAPAFFGTLPPGARLPSGAQCARWVRARPTRENKGVNRPFNRTSGQHVGSSFFSCDTPQAGRHGSRYHAGDMWGCVGRWFAGRWHTAPAQQYIARVSQYLPERIWTQPDVQQR